MSTFQHRLTMTNSARRRACTGLQPTVLALSVALLLSAVAQAQDAAPAKATELDKVQVTGTRGSLTKAQVIKETNDQIID